MSRRVLAPGIPIQAQLGVRNPFNESPAVSQFSIEQIEHIAKLARLDLTPEEKRTFAEQFSSILDYVAMIQTVQLPPELDQDPGDAGAMLRDDEPEVSGIDPESFSRFIERHHFKVPKVIE
jgi:aspartyl-tRNA(Asn)/glutamyl-tRNA(Gln) amidotransferase subunit C